MSFLNRARVALPLAAAALTLTATALAADTVFDKAGDAPSGALDISSAGVDDGCKLEFSMAVRPANAVAPGVMPATSGRLPGFLLDRNGDGRPDRLIGQPKGKTAGIYAVSGTKIGKKVASARRTIDPTVGRVAWAVTYSLAVTNKKIRWRAVGRSAASGAVDRAPDKGFRTTRWSRIGC